MNRFLPFSVLFAILCLNLSADPVFEIQTVLMPIREATIAARVDSVLLYNHCRLGKKFNRGELLMELDARKFAILLERTKAKLNFAEKDYKDKKILREKRISSEWELSKSEFDRNMAKTDYDEAAFNYSCCMISAPFDGKIADLMTREYETVRNGQPLCRIIDDRQLLAVMNVPIREKTLTVPGNPVKIRIGKDRIVQGKVHEVSPIADNRTGTIRIKVLIDNPQGEYSAGLTGVLENGKH